MTRTVLDGPMLLALPIALLAGLVSFLSPCVLPLVPGYLGYVTGLTGIDLEQQRRGRMAAAVALFVLGFARCSSPVDRRDRRGRDRGCRSPRGQHRAGFSRFPVPATTSLSLAGQPQPRRLAHLDPCNDHFCGVRCRMASARCAVRSWPPLAWPAPSFAAVAYRRMMGALDTAAAPIRLRWAMRSPGCAGHRDLGRPLAWCRAASRTPAIEMTSVTLPAGPAGGLGLAPADQHGHRAAVVDVRGGPVPGRCCRSAG
jgi:hypothetical protein